MKSRMAFYPNIRKDYANVQEVADIINKSRAYVLTRLNGQHDFTYREMCMLATASGYTVENARDYCRKEV